LVVIFSVTAAFAHNPETGTMQDSRDGQFYEIIRIGSYWWMAENLNFDAGNGSWCYDDAYFWTSTEKDRSDAWKRFLDDHREQVGRGYDDKREGFSVRCVKD